jgi:hypothetical protein
MQISYLMSFVEGVFVLVARNVAVTSVISSSSNAATLSIGIKSFLMTAGVSRGVCKSRDSFSGFGVGLK